MWHRFTNHPFVLALGNGELPLDSFKKYLVQDYLYLVHFARANALASYKAKNIRDIAAVCFNAICIDSLHGGRERIVRATRETRRNTDLMFHCL